MLIGRVEDFVFTRSKVKFIRVTCKIMVSAHYLKNYHRALIFHVLLYLGENMTSIHFVFTVLMVKVTSASCLKYLLNDFTSYDEDYCIYSAFIFKDVSSVYTLIISHTFCNMLSILIKSTMQKKSQNYVTNNVFLDIKNKQ